MEDLYALKGSGGAAAQNLDDFRQADIPPGKVVEGGVNNIDPLAYYVGRVVRSYGNDLSRSYQLNLAEHIDRKSKIITSINNLLKWDYSKGIATMDAVRAQGATGFLNKVEEIRLGDIALHVENNYASLVAVPLDDKPIKDSAKILIQAMTVERPYGFKASNDNSGRIESLGESPFGVEKVNATVTLFNAGSADVDRTQ